MTGNPTLPPTPAPVPSNGKKAARQRPAWLVRTIIGAVIAVVLVIAFWIASATVPVMWANTISQQVGRNLGAGIPLGMFYGFVFSFVPVVVGWQAHHKKLHKWVRISILVLAVLLTIPNLMTLAVLNGTSNAAVSARVIWSGGANWFGLWSSIFMVLGVCAGIAVVVMARAWRRRGKAIREVKAAEKLVKARDDENARNAKAAAKAAAREAKRNPGS
jgi:hypothetical protein